MDPAYASMPALSPEAPKTGEIALLRAMLTQACADVTARCGCKARTGCGHMRERIGAQRWIMGASAHPFSFVYACQILGLDPGQVRKRVRG